MTSGSKRRLYNALRIAICVAALWFVLQGVSLSDRITLRSGEVVNGALVAVGDPTIIELADGRRREIPTEEIAEDADGQPDVAYGLKSTWSQSRKDFLLLAILLHFPVVFPQALRFQWLLTAQGIAMGYWECLKLTLAGNFLNFATPVGSNAGDVFKAYFVSLHTHHKTEAVTTVFLDRLIGLGTLVLIVTGITIAIPADTRLAALRPYLLIMVGAGIVGALLYLSPLFRRKRWVQELVLQVPGGSHLKRIDQTTRTLVRKWPTTVGSILLTAFLQSLAMAAYISVAVALRLENAADHIFEFLAYFYSGVVIQALPGPPQGLGTVELAYRYFFSPFGSPSQILCMAFAIRVVVLIVSMPGLLVTATGAYRPQIRAAADGIEEPTVMPTPGERAR